MSLRDFLREEKQERKRMRQENKKNKKQPKTKSEKVYKFVSVIFVLVLIIIFFSTTCKSFGSAGNSLKSLIGYTDEIKQNLNIATNETELFGDNPKINTQDYNQLKTTLSSVGIDIENLDSDNSIVPTSSFVLTDRELGALAKNISQDLNASNDFEILSFKMFSVGDIVYEKSIVYIDLSKYISKGNLPKIYISSTSKVKYYDKKLVALTFENRVNNLEEKVSSEILDFLNKNAMLTNFKELCNTNINYVLTLFNSMMNTKIYLQSNGMDFQLL